MQNTPQQEEHTNKSQSLTPGELVHRHMENPDEPITDEDMNNLNLDISIRLPQEKK